MNSRAVRTVAWEEEETSNGRYNMRRQCICVYANFKNKHDPGEPPHATRTAADGQYWAFFWQVQYKGMLSQSFSPQNMRHWDWWLLRLPSGWRTMRVMEQDNVDMVQTGRWFVQENINFIEFALNMSYAAWTLQALPTWLFIIFYASILHWSRNHCFGKRQPCNAFRNSCMSHCVVRHMHCTSVLVFPLWTRCSPCIDRITLSLSQSPSFLTSLVRVGAPNRACLCLIGACGAPARFRLPSVFTKSSLYTIAKAACHAARCHHGREPSVISV